MSGVRWLSECLRLNRLRFEQVKHYLRSGYCNWLRGGVEMNRAGVFSSGPNLLPASTLALRGFANVHIISHKPSQSARFLSSGEFPRKSPLFCMASRGLYGWFEGPAGERAKSGSPVERKALHRFPGNGRLVDGATQHTSRS